MTGTFLAVASVETVAPGNEGVAREGVPVIMARTSDPVARDRTAQNTDDADPVGGAPDDWQTGLAVAATLARKLMIATYEQFGSEHAPKASELRRAAKNALAHLDPPLSTEPIAQAYELLRDVRRKSVASGKRRRAW